MARILIAWELGEAFGHVAPCLQLAQKLKARGHSVALALKDVRLPTGHDAASGITVLQAPLALPRSRIRGVQANYADVLRHSGFADAQDLGARLVAWQGMFSLVRPQVLIGDHSPTALLAAHLAGIPHLAIGIGFSIPPSTSPWPSIRPWEHVPEEALILAEHTLDEVAEAAQKAMGYATPIRMRQLFGAHDVLHTFAELDSYARPNGNYVGPITSLPNARPVSWQSPDGAKVLAYLRPEVPHFSAILQALARLDAEVLCVAPGFPVTAARRYATRRLRISLAPVNLPPLLECAELAVSYGNCGFSTLALLTGVPLLMTPRHVEQRLFARRVEALGAGKLVDGEVDVADVATTLQEMLCGPDLRAAAQAFRDRYRDYSPEQAIERTLSFIEQTIQAGHAPASQEDRQACLH